MDEQTAKRIVETAINLGKIVLTRAPGKQGSPDVTRVEFKDSNFWYSGNHEYKVETTHVPPYFADNNTILVTSSSTWDGQQQYYFNSGKITDDFVIRVVDHPEVQNNVLLSKEGKGHV